MPSRKNMDYILKNFDYGGNVCDWLYMIKGFFGDEQSEQFFEYFIDAHHIMRKNDIRNLISHFSLSVFKQSSKEQLAFISCYAPINREGTIVKNREDGFEKAQKLYREKSMKLANEIKKLGYSYSVTEGNWRDSSQKDTYQREYVFVIYSEKENEEQFKEKIITLAKKCKMNNVLITEKLKDDSSKLQIKSKIFDTKTKEVVQKIENTTIEQVEKYFEKIYSLKFLFKVPYEKNKTILWLDENEIFDYYSKDKQEKIRKSRPDSFNMGMLKIGLLKRFERKDYNGG